MENAQKNSREIYFDNNATTKPLPEVCEEVLRVLGDEFGNPSSAHSTGERARNFLDIARESVSSFIGCNKKNLIFTSSGTEANNLVFHSTVRSKSNNCRILTTSIEHSSIRKVCSFLEINNVEIEYLGVDSKGLIDPSELEESLNKKLDLVSIQWVNNETGVVQDIKTIADMCFKNGVPFHTDAAQAAGKIKFKVSDLPIDYLTIAGHKFHSPQGVGSLYAKDKFTVYPFLFGGFQEEGFRPGTENLPGIVGMGKASEIRQEGLDNTIVHLKNIRDRFESMILDFIPKTKVNGDPTRRVCNTTNIMFQGIDCRKLVRMLDLKGLRCSQSSACTNFDDAPSYVLMAMGLSEEEAYSSIRFSFGVDNTIEEVDLAIDIIRQQCKLLNN